MAAWISLFELGVGVAHMRRTYAHIHSLDLPTPLTAHRFNFTVNEASVIVPFPTTEIGKLSTPEESEPDESPEAIQVQSCNSSTPYPKLEAIQNPEP